MSTVKAYYDGLTFVPIEPVFVPKGRIVNLSIVHEDTTGLKESEKLAAFKKLTQEIRELNQTEPLSQEFDNIISNRVNFTRELNL